MDQVRSPIPYRTYIVLLLLLFCVDSVVLFPTFLIISSFPSLLVLLFYFLSFFLTTPFFTTPLYSFLHRSLILFSHRSPLHSPSHHSILFFPALSLPFFSHPYFPFLSTTPLFFFTTPLFFSTTLYRAATATSDIVKDLTKPITEEEAQVKHLLMLYYIYTIIIYYVFILC
jgi:hypothetical protein